MSLSPGVRLGPYEVTAALGAGGMGEVYRAQSVRVSSEVSPDVVALDEALTLLARTDQREAQVVELRFFAGMSVEETAAALQVSAVTVMRDWRFAKLWLFRAMSAR